MNRIDRLFALQTFLQAKRYAPAARIAEQFGTSVRTVYRDIRALCESGVPVHFEPDKGYRIMEGFFLPPVSFTNEEAAALMLMEGATRVWGDAGIARLYGSALTKIRAVLRAGQQDGMNALAAHTGIQLPPCMEAGYDHLALLQRCVAGRTILEIDYCNKAGEATRRRVEGVGLMYYAMAWHLLGWCHARKAYRDFRVSRIQAARCTGEVFTKHDHPALETLRKELPVDY